MSKGWISVHRKLWDSWLWNDKPFSKGQAWIDLLMLANHTDDKTLIDGNLVDVKRGERITSLRKLSERWGWSITKTKKFFDTLQKEQMIVYKSDTKKTTYTIVNYSDYQDTNNSRSNAEVTQKENRSNTEVTQKETNNNVNNVNNVNKNIYIVEQKQIIDHLNLKTGSNYKYSTSKTQSLINSRIKEGYSVEDFIKVIDVKSEQWLKDSKMKAYLRPETLFGSKFEGYLNEQKEEVNPYAHIETVI